MTKSHSISVLIDRPIIDISSDKFFRHNFAKKIVGLLLGSEKDRHRCASGIIIGLNGAWGSGKTSILNFIAMECEKVDPLIIVKMNPWSVSGDNDAIQLFSLLLAMQLRNALSQARL